MKTTLLATALAAFALAPAAQADPAFGLGLSYVFGGGGGDIAIGARVFSDDTPRDGVLSLGVDYKINSQSLRPSIGAAYLDDDVYGDLSLGYDFGAQNIDFGVGLGGWSN